MDFLEHIKHIVEREEIVCPVCGTSLYITDYNDYKLTFHCSSDAAKFWTFEKGTGPLIESKFHWDRSMREFFIGNGAAFISS